MKRAAAWGLLGLVACGGGQDHASPKVTPVPPSPAHVLCGSTDGSPSLVAEDASIERISVDDSRVYWTYYENPQAPTSAIHAAPKSGGPVEIITSGGPLLSSVSFALDDTYVYWNAQGQGLVRTLKTGGPTSPVFLDAGLGADYLFLAVDATTLYWASTMGNGVGSVPKAGGSATFLDTSARASAFAIDADAVYWGTNGHGTVTRVPRIGGASTTIAVPDLAESILADGATLYVGGLGYLASAPATGGTAAPLVTGIVGGGAAVDATTLYWGAADGIHGVAKHGGAPSLVAAVTDFHGFAIDDDACVYWVESPSNGPNRIMRAPK